MTLDVSVVVPTFNRRLMVREAIDSVIRQRDCCFEVIVIDDGSTDGSWEDLQELAGTHSEHAGCAAIRIAGGENRGVAAARNAGAALARASLIAFLDSDDLWKPDKLALQCEFMRANPECCISQTAEVWIRNGVRVNPGLRHCKRDGDIFVDSLRTCLISPSAAIMRTAVFHESGGFDEEMRAAEDYDLWLRIMVTYQPGFLDAPLVVRRAGHPGQLSATVIAIDRYRILALLKLLGDPRLLPERRAAACAVLAEKCAIYAQGLRRRGHVEAARFISAIAARADSWRERTDDSRALTLAAMRSMLRQPLVNNALAGAAK